MASRPKDLADVESLVVGGAESDEERVERALEEFDALLDLDRTDEWRRLLRRVRA